MSYPSPGCPQKLFTKIKICLLYGTSWLITPELRIGDVHRIRMLLEHIFYV